jgi:hypothetical protein
MTIFFSVEITTTTIILLVIKISLLLLLFLFWVLEIKSMVEMYSMSVWNIIFTVLIFDEVFLQTSGYLGFTDGTKERIFLSKIEIGL